MLQNSDRFSLSLTELKATKLITQEVDLIYKMPVFIKSYKIPNKQEEIMADKINELLEADIICDSVSPYSAPCMLVNKPDGSHRLVVDFRRLNGKIAGDKYPLPELSFFCLVVQNRLNVGY